MKILLIHNFYQQSGGEDIVFRAEAALLRSRGHEVVECVEDNRRLDGVNPLKAALDAVWSRESKRRISALIREHKPGVAHFHNTFLCISPAAYYACKEAGVLVVQTLHNYRLICPVALLMRNGRICEECLGKSLHWPGVVNGCWRGSRIQTAVVASMLTLHHMLNTWQEQVDLYIALTEFARKKFVEGGFPNEKIVVKPNFVSPDPGVGKHTGNYALFVGRLSTEKGVGTLLEAWERLGSRIPLIIVGDGPLALQVAEAAERIPAVQWLGRRAKNEVLARMKSATLLIFPSMWYETFGLTIVEAFATGLPVIASRLGAMAEIVEDGCTGLHFESGNVEDLAEKVSWAWSHPQEIAEMGQKARHEYEEKYTAEKNYEMLMSIYEQAIRGR